MSGNRKHPTKHPIVKSVSKLKKKHSNFTSRTVICISLNVMCYHSYHVIGNIGIGGSVFLIFSFQFLGS